MVQRDDLRRSRCPATVRRGLRRHCHQISEVANDRPGPASSSLSQPITGAKAAEGIEGIVTDRRPRRLRRRRRSAKTRTRTLYGPSRPPQPPPPPLNQPRRPTTKVIASTVHIGRGDRVVGTIIMTIFMIHYDFSLRVSDGAAVRSRSSLYVYIQTEIIERYVTVVIIQYHIINESLS